MRISSLGHQKDSSLRNLLGRVFENLRPKYYNLSVRKLVWTEWVLEALDFTTVTTIALSQTSSQAENFSLSSHLRLHS